MGTGQGPTKDLGAKPLETFDILALETSLLRHKICSTYPLCKTSKECLSPTFSTIYFGMFSVNKKPQ